MSGFMQTEVLPKFRLPRVTSTDVYAGDDEAENPETTEFRE